MNEYIIMDTELRKHIIKIGFECLDFEFVAAVSNGVAVGVGAVVVVLSHHE